MGSTCEGLTVGGLEGTGLMMGPALGEGVSAGAGGSGGPGVGCCQIGITRNKTRKGS